MRRKTIDNLEDINKQSNIRMWTMILFLLIGLLIVILSDAPSWVIGLIIMIFGINTLSEVRYWDTKKYFYKELCEEEEE